MGAVPTRKKNTMATRGIIAVQRAGGFRGRYVHWDNYPSRLVDVLGSIAKREGLTQMVTTLINDNASWSVIDDEQGTEVGMLGYDKDNIIKGYGVIHSDMNPLDDLLWFTEKSTDFAGAEYLYVIRGEGLEVFNLDNDSPVSTEIHAWETIGLTPDTPVR